MKDKYRGKDDEGPVGNVSIKISNKDVVVRNVGLLLTLLLLIDGSSLEERAWKVPKMPEEEVLLELRHARERSHRTS